MIKNRTKFIFLILVISVGFAAYSNSLTNEFLWDDELLVINNKYIKDLGNTPALFTKNITYSTNIESNLYRPLQMLTYSLNYALCKLDIRAYHLTNIVLHILVAIMLYGLTQLLAKNEVLSLITALLFISHPIHTEAVTYISGRADLLAALFILLAIIFYIKYSQNAGKISFYLLSIISFLFALLSKEIAIIVPLLLLAYDYIYRKSKKVSFKRHIPFFSLGFIYIILRKTVLNFPIQKTVIDQFTFLQRLPAIFKSLTMYFEKLLFPLNLHMEYEPIIPSITDVRVILGVVIAIILIVLAIIYRKRQRLVSFSLAWFLINYLPISNIYPLNAFFAEHWIYTPCLGLFMLVGWTAVKIYKKGQILKLLTCLALGFLLVCNFHLTIRQNRYWENPEDFYQRILQYAPNSPRVYFRLGLLYFRKGLIDKGIEKTKKALEIDPNYSPSYENLAAGYIMKGAYDKAIVVGEQALGIGPHSDVLHNNLGIAYSAKGRYKEAIIEFKKAVEINANYATVHNNLARAYYDRSQYDLAIRHCDRAIELGFKVHPDFLELLEPLR